MEKSEKGNINNLETKVRKSDHVKNFSPRLVWKDPRKGMSTTWRQKSESQKGEGQKVRHSTSALSEIKPNNNLGEILR